MWRLSKAKVARHYSTAKMPAVNSALGDGWNLWWYSEACSHRSYSGGLFTVSENPDFTVLPTPLPPPPSHLVINLIPDASVANAPVGFWSAMTAAAQFFDNTFSNPITVNITVAWDEIGGSPLLNGNLGEGGPVTGSLSTYNQVRTALAIDAKSGADMTALASLSAVDPTNGGPFFIGSAEEKALGLTPGNAAAVDGQVGFQSDLSFPFTFDPNNRAVAGDLDFIGVAEHEIAHAMGRDAYLGLQSNSGDYSILDLYRYSSPAVHDFTLTDSTYFSIDGGITAINSFSTMSDPADWAGSTPNAFDLLAPVGAGKRCFTRRYNRDGHPRVRREDTPAAAAF